MKKFAINFVVSLAGYLVISLFIAIALGLPMMLPNIRSVYAGFHMIVIAGLYFLLGTLLNPLGKHWKNYLSVCGSFIVALSLLLWNFDSIVAFNTSFAGLGYLIHHLDIDVFTASIMLTPLPSIFTWLGMVWKSNKLKKKQAEVTS